jgi:hypothetical protein
MTEIMPQRISAGGYHIRVLRQVPFAIE